MQHNHEYCQIENILNILKVANKINHLDVLEILCIYEAAKCKQVLNEQYLGEDNALLDLIIEKYKRQTHDQKKKNL